MPALEIHIEKQVDTRKVKDRLTRTLTLERNVTSYGGIWKMKLLQMRSIKTGHDS